MRDPLTWSLPIGRAFGIAIRLHLLFPVFALGMILRYYYGKDYLPGTWIDAAMLMGLLFVVVLLHEFGHCFGARRVDGDAHEILMWPLGGLAYVEVPRTPWANFVTVAAGPAVNLVICLVVVVMYFAATGFELRPTWNPFWAAGRIDASGAIELYRWNGTEFREASLGVIVLARLFWVSWGLFLLNVLLPAFPLDGGRMLQCALWPRYGYAQATMVTVYGGFGTAVVLGVLAIVFNEMLLMGLCLFIYVSCKNQWLELVQAEEGLFGYDFSQGYTSLEGEPLPLRKKKLNFVQRWLQRRSARKMQREQEQREADERRMDELLQKIHDHGLQALTEDERRFLTRQSARNKNR